jgi:hypothetical protein
MGGSRIDVTREALKLFIQSLPVGSQFAIIGFGTNHDYTKTKDNKQIWNYNDDTMK